MKFRNINSKFGNPEIFDTLPEMEEAIVACGYDLDEELEEGRDYEIVPEFRVTIANVSEEFPEWATCFHCVCGVHYPSMIAAQESASILTKIALITWQKNHPKATEAEKESARENAPEFYAEVC